MISDKRTAVHTMHSSWTNQRVTFITLTEISIDLVVASDGFLCEQKSSGFFIVATLVTEVLGLDSYYLNVVDKRIQMIMGHVAPPSFL